MSVNSTGQLSIPVYSLRPLSLALHSTDRNYLDLVLTSTFSDLTSSQIVIFLISPLCTTHPSNRLKKTPNRGSPIPDALPTHLDLILAADCVYFEPAFPLLVDTLCALMHRQANGDLVKNDGALEVQQCPEVLFCYKKRRKVRLSARATMFNSSPSIFLSNAFCNN